MQPQADVSRWPIIEVHFARRSSLEELDAHFDFLEEMFRTRGRFLTVSAIDDIGPETATAVARRLVADRIDDLASRGAFIAEFVVVRSPFMRGVFTAYSWLRKNKTHDLRAFARMEEALQAAQSYVDSGGAGSAEARSAG